MTTITISKGATSYNLTNYLNVNLVQKNSLEIRESEYGSGYTPTINSASFKMLFAGPPASLLLEDDVEVIIANDGSPLFTGYARPLTNLDFSGMGRGDSINVECLGSMSKLDAQHSGETVDLAPGGAIATCNAATPTTSYVHLMLVRLNWARGLVAPTLSNPVPLALIRDGDRLLDSLARVLFCAGYYLTELPNGDLAIRPFGVENPIATKKFSVVERNIIKSLGINKKESEETSVAVTYGKFNRIPEYALYSEDIQHAVYTRHYSNPSDRKPWVWPYDMDAEGVPPYLYNKTTDWTWNTRYGIVQKKLAQDGTETSQDDILIPFPAPDVTGLQEGLWKYTSLRAEITFWDQILINASWVGSYRFSGAITAKIDSSGIVSYWRGPGIPLEADHPLNRSVAASWNTLGLNLIIGPIPYINDDQRYIYLEGLTLYGTLEYIHSNPDALADDDAPRVVIGGTDNAKRLKQSADFCLQPADAERIARALLASLNAPIAKFKSADDVACGSVVHLPHDARGIDITGRVIQKTSSVDRRIFYAYEVEGLSALTIESSYYPAILAGLGSDPGPGQTIAELIAARIRQAHADAGIVELGEQLSSEDDRLTDVEDGLQRVRNGEIIDGAIDRAALEAGFVDEHEKSISELWPSGLESPSAVDIETEARLAEVAAERERLDLLEPEIFPQGPDAPSAPEIIAGDLLSVGALTEILEREIASRDRGLVMAEQRILLIAQDTEGALEKVASLEITVGEIEAIVAEFSGDHTRISALELQADGIEASVSDYGDEKAKIAALQLTVDSINSILAELNVGGEIINLSLIVQNADRIAQIVADGGYTDAENVFHPTKAYTQVTQLSDRYELFLAGDDTEKGQAAWIATVDQISSFVTALEVTGVIDGALAPVEAAVSAIEQRADSLELSVADVAGSIEQAALENRETLLAALDQLEAQASSSIILTQNRIDLIVARQDGENVSLWARIALEADRITSEVGRAVGAEVDLSSRITQEAGRITQEIEDRTQGLLDARSYIDQRATSILSSVESGMQALDGTLRDVAATEAAEAEATATAYADGIVSDEEQRAITDAQAKADAARAAAITAAAADAASKADAAEQAAALAAAVYTDSQILQLGDAIIARVAQTEIALDPQEDGSVAYKAVAAWAQLLLEPGTFATRIQTSEDGIIRNGSLIEQVKDLISLRVDEALSESTAGIVIAGNRIELAVAEQRSSSESLLAQLSIEADRISSEVLRAIEGEATLASQIVQQASQISARVRASQYNSVDGTWSDVQAIMALTVTLPSVISLERYDAIRALLDASCRPLFDTAYEQFLAPWSENGGQTWESDVRYQISPAATAEDLAALRVAMAAAGVLSSQFLVDADEVFMPGTIRGRHLEMESVSTELFTALQARIQELSAKRLKVDTNPAIGTDYEVYVDEDNGILVRKNGVVIFSVNPATGRVYIYGDADIENGVFRGSIESGPLVLNKNPPTSESFIISGPVALFMIDLSTHTGLSSGKFTCTGTYNGIEIEAVSLQITSAPKNQSYRQWGPSYYKAWCYYYDWTATNTVYDISITFYRKSDHTVLFSYSEHYEPSVPWIRGDMSGAEYPSSPYPSTWAPEPSPNPIPVVGGQSFPASGTLSFTSGAFTYALLNLPSGYSQNYPIGTVYVDATGFLKIRT